MELGFVDTDGLIEEQLGRSISDIFSREGEAAFRQYEKKALAGLAG
jgi:shikimate kinase